MNSPIDNGKETPSNSLVSITSQINRDTPVIPPESPNAYRNRAITSPNKLTVPFDKLSGDHKTEIRWFKVAVLGATTAGAMLICSMLILSLSAGPFLQLAIIFQGAKNALILVVIIASAISGRVLLRSGLNYPFFISSLSLIIVVGLYLLTTKLVPSTFSSLLVGNKLTTLQKLLGNPLIIVVFALGLSALFFVLLTYLTNRSNYPRISILLFAILIGVLFFLPIKNGQRNYDQALFLKVKDLNWAVLPSYLPAGVVDYLDTTGGCSNKDANVTNYECEYQFKNYPGYLSQGSQTQINLVRSRDNTYRGYYAPDPFFKLTVYKDDPLLEQFKIKEGKCDILAMNIIGTSPLENRNVTANKQANNYNQCSGVKTPKGKILYYEAPDGIHKDTLLNVPWYYYFQQDGLVISIAIDSYDEVGFVKTLYFSDTNFQPELYKFVDGIN